MAASRGDTGPPATLAAPAGARSSSASRRPACLGSGPTQAPASTATSSISSASPPARARSAPPSPRRAPSSHRRPMPSSPITEDYDRTEAARRLWQRCRAIDGTHAEAYLSARGIQRCRFAALRFHPALFHRDDGGVRRLPALVAAVTADAEERSAPEEHPGPGELPGHAAVCGVHAHVVGPRPARQGLRVASAQGAGTHPRPRRPLRRAGVRHAARRRGHRDGAVNRHRDARHRRRRGALRRQPRRIRAACRRHTASSSPETTTPRASARPNASSGAAPGPASTRMLVVVPECDDFNSDLVALGPQALAARLAPILRLPLRAGE